MSPFLTLLCRHHSQFPPSLTHSLLTRHPSCLSPPSKARAALASLPSHLRGVGAPARAGPSSPAARARGQGGGARQAARAKAQRVAERHRRSQARRRRRAARASRGLSPDGTEGSTKSRLRTAGAGGGGTGRGSLQYCPLFSPSSPPCQARGSPRRPWALGRGRGLCAPRRLGRSPCPARLRTTRRAWRTERAGAAKARPSPRGLDRGPRTCISGKLVGGGRSCGSGITPSAGPPAQAAAARHASSWRRLLRKLSSRKA